MEGQAILWYQRVPIQPTCGRYDPTGMIALSIQPRKGLCKQRASRSGRRQHYRTITLAGIILFTAASPSTAAALMNGITQDMMALKPITSMCAPGCCSPCSGQYPRSELDAAGKKYSISTGSGIAGTTQVPRFNRIWTLVACLRGAGIRWRLCQSAQGKHAALPGVPWWKRYWRLGV